MKQHSRSRNTNWQSSVAILLTLGELLFANNHAGAQIIPDHTLGGSNSIVQPINSLLDRINGGAIRGNNLFHSFQEFNIGQGQSAYFTDPTGITNIFSRVTGSNPSQLLGTLGVAGNANLFFLNPNGIIFGPNAKLDISGSFVASTANSVVFPNGMQFSASNPEAPPLLRINLPAPIRLQFASQQPGALVNTGNLAAGQNLSLVGGTVVSTGTLSAPNGELAVVTVPGIQADGSTPVVNLGQSGQFVNWEMSPSTSGSNQPVTSGGSFTQANQQLLANPVLNNIVTVNSDGTATLNNGNRSIVPGDIVAKNVSSQTAILNAANNLTLVESTLQTTGDLHLLAQNDVIAGDMIQPFIAQALGSLLVQGNQGVFIIALNNPNSGLFSGKDMVLRSPNDFEGDAHLFSNGSFQIEQLDGSLGNWYGFYNPIIRASGDVSFANYAGASLQILAGGSVNIPGNIKIIGVDTSNSLAENVTLSDGKTVIPINGSTQPTLDIRAGTTAVGIPEIGNTTTANNGTSADINIGSITNNDGVVFLTNQYAPKTSLPGGTINVGGIDTSNGIYIADNLNGGDVTIDARNNIVLTGNLFSVSVGNNTGNGGAINLLAGGSIIATDIFSFSNNSNTGNGGAINFLAGGSIIATGIFSFSNNSNAGNGGAINLQAGGYIATGDIGSSSANSNAGSGGAINLQAGGYITATGNIDSSSFANSNAGSGGAINLQAGGYITATGNINSSSSANSNAGNGGAINLQADGNITATGEIDSGSQDTKSENRAGITLIHGNGDISFNSYSGGSLQILAGGSVNIPGSVVITGVDMTNSFAENVTLSDGKTVIPINGSTQPTLDIRAGTTAIASEFQGSTTGFSTTTANNGTTGTSADINIGSIFNLGSGVVFLTNQYAPKISLPGGAINVGSIDTFTIADNNSNGGAVTIDARSNIIIPNGIDSSAINGNGAAVNLLAGGNIDTPYIESYSSFNNGNAGNGGAVNLFAGGNIISTYYFPSLFIESFSSSMNGNAGNGGAVNLFAGGNITTAIDSFSLSTNGKAGNGGDITLSSNMGNININTSSAFNSFSYSDYGDVGNGGAITLSAKNGDVIGSSLDSFAISKTGNAQMGGNVTIEAKNNITGINILSISSSSQSGEVNLTGFSDLSVTNDSIITSKQVTVKLPFPTNEESITLDIGGIGQSGNTTITSSGNLTFNNTLVKSDAIGINPAGNINISSPGLITFNNSQITSNTINAGQGGSINIQAGEGLSLDPQSSISTQSSNSGAAGSINIQSPILTFTGSNLSASNQDGPGGNITITANDFNATDGAQLQTSTTGSAQAGDIILKVLNNVTLTGKNTGVFANTAIGSTGNGGVIKIDPNTLNVQDGAQIAVNSQGSGTGGNITLVADKVNLNNGTISAQTLSNTGGNINLTIQDLLQMQNGSTISATAGNGEFGGNGGNINITGYPFIIAFPTEGNSITANAFKGQGGNINISTPDIFGRDYLDITASSNFGENGQIAINTSGIDPTKDLAKLPQEVIRPEDEISQSPCQPKSTNNQSELYNLGRGGLPPNPSQSLNSNEVNARWVEPDKTATVSHKASKSHLETNITVNQEQTEILPAMGWIRNEKGEVILVAYDTSNVNPERQVTRSSTCMEIP
jgi:filamentous hemagglutinin family protein